MIYISWVAVVAGRLEMCLFYVAEQGCIYSFIIYTYIVFSIQNDYVGPNDGGMQWNPFCATKILQSGYRLLLQQSINIFCVFPSLANHMNKGLFN